MTAASCHPGDVWAQKPKAHGVTPTELARHSHAGEPHHKIVNDKRTVTSNSALRLAHWFGDNPEQLMSLQARYDLEVAKTGSGGELSSLPTRLHLCASPVKRQPKSVHGRAA